MSIEAEFKQVSPYLLEKLKKYPDFAELFFYSQYLPDSPFWQEYTINPDDPDDVEYFNEFTNFAKETLEKLKKEKPEDFKKLEAEIPCLLEEGKGEYLNLSSNWRSIHFLLTGEDDTVQPLVLVGENDEDHLPSINAVKAGREIEFEATYGLVRYLNAEEVKQIAEALLKLSRVHLWQRWNSKGWDKKVFNSLLKYEYHALVKYYQDAAVKENAMFLYLC